MVRDAEGGIECCGRILRHVGDESSAEVADGALAERREVVVAAAHGTTGYPQPRPGIPEAGKRCRRLPASGLADQPEDTPRLHVQRDTPDDLAFGGIDDAHVTDFEQRSFGVGHPR